MTSLEAYLNQANTVYLDDCTRCGKCVEVCPVTPVAGIDANRSSEIVDEIVGLFDSGPLLDGDSKIWAHQCNGCGVCIPACPEDINPRRMLMLANTSESQVVSETPQLFRKMARAIRIMAAMQLAPPEFQKLTRNPRARDVPVVFYLGCNPIRTPHLLLNAMTILDALEIDYETVGGPGACCGIIHSKWEGEIDKADRVSDGTLTRFEEFTPEHVLSWCPSCVLHLGETIDGYRDTSFNFDHITQFMADRVLQLRDKFVRPVDRRVLLHIHDGMPGIGQNVVQLLADIPGLTIVEAVSEPGYTCGGSGADRSPNLKKIKRDETVARAEADDVDALVTLFHGCHGQLAKEEGRGKFEVLNWTDLVVEALGEIPHVDMNKRYRLQQDWDMVLDEGEIYLKANGVNMDRVWLKGLLPDIFAQSEFKGGLESFGTSN